MPWIKDKVTGERKWFPSGGVSRETVQKMIDDAGGVSDEEVKTAVEEALTQAKESGEFKGDKGDPGSDYILTEADKTEIAEQAAELAGTPDVDMSGLVKSVNGNTPDENGNVEIETGSEQVQADWTVNDTADPAYVKNRALSVSDAISMSGIDIVNADIVWSDTPSYSINNGDVVSGKGNYITPDAIAVPDGYTSAVLENINGSTFTWQGVAQYDADMAFIKYTEGSASTRCLAVRLDANTKFVRFSVYPNGNSDPENGMAVAFFDYQ